MVLVDTSIWIEYFNNGEHQSLEHLLSENLVVTNDIVLTELLPFLMNENDVRESLNAIPKIELNINWESIKKLQELNHKEGLNKVGIPDLIIVQQVIQEKLTIWSRDKHFSLMKNHMNFDLYL